MKKLPIIVCTLGLSVGLLGTSAVGAASDSSNAMVKEKALAVSEQNSNEGVQPRWAGKAATWAAGVLGGLAFEAAKNSSGSSSSSGGYSGSCYASAGGMVGGHAPEMDRVEFGR
ncbi:hypothetical protein AVT_13110 [Bacillus tropicus]|uniref:Bacteriocin n=1 Tax=Bacillus shihchuchen TaxID=3036942 RepID=A0ABT7KYC8_9BACI|nr:MULTISPECIES: hypothetical protein [Bacillus]MDL2419114.1 hypothetical protein [Bacillus shihchuchen]OTX88382.1 hypothetical protein BK728_05045 [Bacillus thuringiensis serovar chanpaisis]PNK25432.1 hypothetical protein CBR56_21745 [Bacillus thuringiensis]MED3037998.1 hypothetical protein [Bacillus tropicus]PGB54859.1 hypothetical protein COL95_08300 [Bacillus anthracis]